MNNTFNTPKPQTTHTPDFRLKGRGTILISPRIAAEITALHKSCGSDEWSGILVFEPICEEIVNPDKYIARAVGVYPMNYGNAAYTEYGVGIELLDLYEKFPQADPASGTPTYKLGQIHSHHNMAAFFSGTDDSELRDNAPKYEYYLSLIVNFNGKYCAKIAFEAELPQDIKMRDKIISQPAKPILAMFELDVQMEVEPWFQEKMDDFHAAKKTVSHTSYGHSGGYGDEYWNFTDRKNGQSAIGFQSTGGKKDEEKVKKESQPDKKTIGKATLGEGQIKAALPYLFLEDEKEAADVTFFWIFDRHPLKDGTAKQIEFYIERLKTRLEPWLNKYFGRVIVDSHGEMEEFILGRTLELVRLYTVDTPVAQAIYDFLEEYIDTNYVTELS